MESLYLSHFLMVLGSVKDYSDIGHRLVWDFGIKQSSEAV